MKKLIDADALLRRKCREPARGDCKNCDWYKDSHCGQEIFGVEIASFPAVDAIEVVRCVNCQSHEPCEVRNRVWCKTMGRYMKEDGFCSEGVKNDA